MVSVMKEGLKPSSDQNLKAALDIKAAALQECHELCGEKAVSTLQPRPHWKWFRAAFCADVAACDVTSASLRLLPGSHQQGFLILIWLSSGRLCLFHLGMSSSEETERMSRR